MARERLKKRFGGVLHIVDAHLAQVADGPHIKQDDVFGLDRLLVNMESCFLTLKEWNAMDRLNSPETLSKILDRLPSRLQHQFNEKCAELYSLQQEPSFEKLMRFIESRVIMGESRLGKKLLSKTKKPDPQVTHISKTSASQKTQISSVSTQGYSRAGLPGQRQDVLECTMCKGDHHLAKCQSFVDKSINEKKQFIVDNRLCYNCLQSGHTVRDCRSRRYTAINCGRKHHTLIHPSNSQEAQESDRPSSASSQTETQAYSLNATSPVTGGNKVRLKVLPVKVWNWNQSEMVQEYAFLDEESDTTMCTLELANKLSVKGSDTLVSIRTVNGLTQMKGKYVSFTLQGMSSSEHYWPRIIDLPRVLAVNSLPASLTNCIPNEKDMRCVNHLRNVMIPDLAHQKVQLLIGADTLAAHVQHDIRFGESGQPAAVLAGLGWTLFGPDVESNKAENSVVQSNFIQTSNADSVQLHEKLDRMFKFDFSEAKEVSKPFLS